MELAWCTKYVSVIWRLFIRSLSSWRHNWRNNVAPELWWYVNVCEQIHINLIVSLEFIDFFEKEYENPSEYHMKYKHFKVPYFPTRSNQLIKCTLGQSSPGAKLESQTRERRFPLEQVCRHEPARYAHHKRQVRFIEDCPIFRIQGAIFVEGLHSHYRFWQSASCCNLA